MTIIRDSLLPPPLKRKSGALDLDTLTKQLLEKLGRGTGICASLSVAKFPEFAPTDVRSVSFSARIWQESDTVMYTIVAFHPNSPPGISVTCDVPEEIFRKFIQAAQPGTSFSMSRFRLGFSDDISLTELLNSLGTSQSTRRNPGSIIWHTVASPSPQCSMRSS